VKVVADDRGLVGLVYMLAGEAEEADHSPAEVAEGYMIAEVSILIAGGRVIAEADRRAGKVLHNLGQANNCVQDDLDDQ